MFSFAQFHCILAEAIDSGGRLFRWHPGNLKEIV